MKRDIFIGGAWPYANYYLHIGHLAALLPGDILARYFRLKGDNVIYVSGSDCHGTPITERAKKENTSPSDISSHYHEEFVNIFNLLEFEYDKYSKTSSKEHSDYVKDIILKIKENGYIYEKEVPQDYCNICNKFLSDREIEGICPHCGGKSTGDQCDECLTSVESSELIDKHCKTCGSTPVLKDNKHLYFKLSEFTESLQKLIDDNKNTWRKNALGETQKYLDMGLIDRAVTRQLDWGIEVPIDGYSDKRIYVWIEAVLGYLSVGSLVANKRGIDFDKFMSNDNPNLLTYYVHGKDNISFHTVIFPSIIKATGNNYRLPDKIISSAYVNLNDEKMSKSKGNLITVKELLETFSADTLRFYFLFNGPETKDTNCSVGDIIQVNNKFLVGMLGNFVNRNLSFINKKFDGVITSAEIDQEIISITKEAYKKIGLDIENGEFKSALNQIMEYISLGNKFYDSKEPWKQVKEDIEEFNKTTYTCIYMIANIANLINPIMPNTSLKIKDMLSLENVKWEEEMIKGDIRIKSSEILFERIEDI